jgi:hypothetical protein
MAYLQDKHTTCLQDKQTAFVDSTCKLFEELTCSSVPERYAKQRILQLFEDLQNASAVDTPSPSVAVSSTGENEDLTLSTLQDLALSPSGVFSTGSRLQGVAPSHSSSSELFSATATIMRWLLKSREARWLW